MVPSSHLAWTNYGSKYVGSSPLNDAINALLIENKPSTVGGNGVNASPILIEKISNICIHYQITLNTHICHINYKSTLQIAQCEMKRSILRRSILIEKISNIFIHYQIKYTLLCHINYKSTLIKAQCEMIRSLRPILTLPCKNHFI